MDQVSPRLIVAAKWKTALPRFHDKLSMSTQYRHAMQEDGQWNYERDLAFALSVLCPETKKIIASDTPPDAASLDALPWIDTSHPGVYFCQAIKVNSQGVVVSRMDKIGCAWSKKGLRGRRSSQEATRLRGRTSSFAGYTHTVEPGLTLVMKWHTLAVGDKFVRRGPEDEYLAGRWYQIETMLAGAFGTWQNFTRWKSPDLQWWPFAKLWYKNPFEGNDHNAMTDTWTSKWAVVLSEAEKKEQRREMEKKRKARLPRDLLCTVPGCERSLSGQGFANSSQLRDHEAVHEKGGKVQSFERARKTLTDGDSRKTQTNGDPLETQIYEESRKMLMDEDSLEMLMKEDSLETQMDEDSLETQMDEDSLETLTDEELRDSTACFDYRCGFTSGPDEADVHEAHETAHKTGEFPCGACGLLFFRAKHATKHAAEECKVENAVQLHAQAPTKPCYDDRCNFDLFNLTTERSESHENSHKIGKFPCGACMLLFVYAHQATKHAAEDCKVENAVELHKPYVIPTPVCSDPRCGIEFPASDKGQQACALHEKSHSYIKGVWVCRVCDLRMGKPKNHPGRTNGICPGSPSMQVVDNPPNTRARKRKTEDQGEEQ